jgi:hypothetical protein
VPLTRTATRPPTLSPMPSTERVVMTAAIFLELHERFPFYAFCLKGP